MLKKLNSLDFEKNYHKYLRTAILAIIVFKLLLMGVFSSDYQDLMFIPFVKCFLQGKNPYQYYYDNNLLSSFPYPPVMLFLECIGGVFVTFAGQLPIFWQNLIFKLPIFLMDLLGLYYLLHISVSRRKYILVLYFLSPIVLYASYMHGQLDIIPTVFLIGAIYYLTKPGTAVDKITANDWKFVIFLTLSLASKFHIAAALPLFFLYIYKKKGRSRAIVMTGLPILFTAALVVPFWGSGFANMVLLNKEQNAIGNVFLDYGNDHLLLAVVVLLFIYFQAFRINQMNRDLLISMTGLLFSVFLIFVPAMPAWFIWIVPFFMLYLAGLSENRGKMVLTYGVFNILYLIYYVFFHVTEFADVLILGKAPKYLKIENSQMRNVIFTLMVSVFLILVISMYRYGIDSNSYYRRRNRPFTMGIAGDSGAGKSKLLLTLEELLSKEHILNIEGDGDHKWERGDANWNEMTHLNPQANYLYRQAEDLRILRGNNAVKRAEYDHDTGAFTNKKKVYPKPYIVMCGLHSLYLPQMRKVLDMKIYLDTEETLRCYWKLKRDEGNRGYDRATVMTQIEKRREDAEKYIYPQKQYADLVIRYFDKELMEHSDIFDSAYEVHLSVEFLMDVSINAEPVLAILREHGVESSLRYDDFLHQRIILDADHLQVSGDVWAETACVAIPQMEDLTGGKIIWEDGISGAVQLMLLVVISEIMKSVERV